MAGAELAGDDCLVSDVVLSVLETHHEDNHLATAVRSLNERILWSVTHIARSWYLLAPWQDSVC
jgi:hypothetical protein